MQSEINIKVGNKAPSVYLGDMKEQCTNGGGLKYGGIDNLDMLIENLKENSIPTSIFEMDLDDYEGFLNERRSLMAKKIKNFYQTL